MNDHATLPERVLNRDTTWASKTLGTYLTYGGAWFDKLGREDASPDEITAVDLLAVQALSVKVPTSGAIRVLRDQRQELTTLLRAVPAGLTLVDASPEALDPSSPASRLWALLRGARDGLGPTIVSKILARKRPLLIPVWDSVVGAVTRHDTRGFWEWMRQQVQTDDGALWTWLVEVRDRTPGAEHLSPLRVLDILIWMSGHGSPRTALAELGEGQNPES